MEVWGVSGGKLDVGKGGSEAGLHFEHPDSPRHVHVHEHLSLAGSQDTRSPFSSSAPTFAWPDVMTADVEHCGD